MRNRPSLAPLRALVLATALSLAAFAPASAAPLQITVTNDQPAGGFAISGVWFGAHDGTFSTFSPGTTASTALESIAELGDTSLMTAAFNGHGSQTTVGSGPLTPGASTSGILDVANPAATPYLSFAGMVVPSNDFFFGNADPKGFQLFDASGHYVGLSTIQIFGSNVWDAGTEVNNINFGAAFIVGDNATDHVAANGTVQLVFGGPNNLTSYLDSIDGKATPGGYSISHLISAHDLIATIQITPVPEPSSLAVVGTGVVALLAGALKNRRSRSPSS